jgi:phosphoenolpyruvate carboxylase
MEKFCVSPEKQTIFIGHGDCIDDAGILASMVEQRFALKNIAVKSQFSCKKSSTPVGGGDPV